MRTSIRRGLSALAALTLVVGSALVASPAQAAVDSVPEPLTRFDSPTEGQYVSGDVHVTGQLGSVYLFASYSVDGGSQTTLFSVDSGDSSVKPFDFTLSGLSDGSHFVTVFTGP